MLVQIVAGFAADFDDYPAKHDGSTDCMPCDPGSPSEDGASYCPLFLAGCYGDSDAANMGLPCWPGIYLIKMGERAVSSVLQEDTI